MFCFSPNSKRRKAIAVSPRALILHQRSQSLHEGSSALNCAGTKVRSSTASQAHRLDVISCPAQIQKEVAKHLNELKAPAGYVPGIGRGGTYAGKDVGEFIFLRNGLQSLMSAIIGWAS